MDRQTDQEISSYFGQRTRIIRLVPDTKVVRQVSDINLLVWVTVYTKHPHTNSAYTPSGQNKQSLVVLEARIFPTGQRESYFWLHVCVLFRVCVKLLKPDYSRQCVHNWPLKKPQEQQIASEPDILRNVTPSRPDLSDLSLPLKRARCLEEHQFKGLQNNRQS